ncbi:MAG: hypothetical protein ACM3S1_12950, partial [Hyphomicrobiales bacterium]
ELVEGNFPTELQKDISDIERNLSVLPEDGGWAERVAKVLALLTLVRDVPRTPENIAAFLIDRVGQLPPLEQVKGAIDRLKQGQYVRETDEGYKLQTNQEKSWDAERRGHLAPRPKDRNDIRRELLGDIFSDSAVRTFRFQDLKTFRIGVKVDDAPVGDSGQITLSILVADDATTHAAKLEEARQRSRPPANELFWTLTMTNDLDDLVAELHASRRMISAYTQRRAQEQITPNQSELLRSEQGEEQRLHRRLRDRMVAALEAGTTVFQGVARDGSDLGKTLPDMLRGLIERAIPELYPKLSLGAARVKGSEPEEVLKAANLNGLSQVLYETSQGLGLVKQEGDRWVPNLEAPTAKEVLDHLRKEQSYGNKVLGKALEQHFGGPGYGWELDVLRLVAAVLLRAGAIEVTHQGRRYRNHQDPQSRVPLTNTPAFRAASFAPRESAPTLKDLTRAVEQYEQLTGGEVDVEEAAIAAALKRFAEAEMQALVPLEATARAHRLDSLLVPVSEYRSTLVGIEQADTDDAVRILAGEGQSLRAARDQVRHVGEALQASNLEGIQLARRAADDMWPVIRPIAENGELEAAVEEVRRLLASEQLHEELASLSEAAGVVVAAYDATYTSIHTTRAESAVAAIDEVQADEAWTAIPTDLREDLLKPLAGRACQALSLNTGALRCTACEATIPQMQSDVEAIPALQATVRERIQAALAPPDQQVVRVRVSAFFAGGIDTQDAIDAALERFREHLLKLLDEGARIVLE